MEGIGFPQLNAATYPSQLFWLAVAFVILYTLMSKIALPMVGRVLEARSAQKDGNLSDAASMSKEAEGIRTAYERALAKAQRDASEAMAAAEKAVGDKVAAAQSHFAENSRNRLAAAEKNIAQAKAEALRSLTDISAEVAAGMVQKIAGITVDKAAAKTAVEAAMKEG